jgi:hypothetical protein
MSGSTPTRSHALWDLLVREIHAPTRAPTRSGRRSTRLLAREMHALAATGFAREPHAPGALPRSRAYWRVRCTRPSARNFGACSTRPRRYSQCATRLLAREMHAPFSQHTLARALHAPGVPHHHLLPRVSQSGATSALALPRVKLHKKKKKKKNLIRIQYFRPDPTG